MNSLSIYLRPFLEGITEVDLNGLSMIFLCVGLGGMAGMSMIGFFIRRHLILLLIGMPSALAILALFLIVSGAFAAVTTALLVLWGFAPPRSP